MTLDVAALVFASTALSGLMVRYAPTSPANLLKHVVRASIVDYLKTNKCASITELCRGVQIPWGVAQHHLYVLRRAGLVRSAPHGRTHLFFGAGQNEASSGLFALLRSIRAREILATIQTVPGVRQKDLCDRVGVTRKVFRHHMNLLTAAGLVVENRQGKLRVYQPTPLLAQKMPDLLGTAPSLPSAGSPPSGPAVRPGASDLGHNI